MVSKLAVIGAGQMGSGIAHTAALCGVEVILNDVSQERLDKALADIARGMGRQVAKGRLSEEDRDAAMGRISASLDLAAIAGVDMAIEAATEKEELKRDIFARVCKVLPPEVIIASNTSSIPITRLAAATDRPAKFIGMHFMNPVPVMQLVEVIRGLATDEATYQTVIELAARMGKTAATAEDFPAFIVNRILLPMINEAVYTLYEGVGSVESIDTCLKLGANHPMGPLELADFIGLDTCLA
ncbi:MAG: 3-hydroxyacyl-CoA dehydrogenase NAD-binding domain-containing protein, partial [Alphaproteobacteria bacterium]